MKLYPEKLNRDFNATDENSKIQSAYERMIFEQNMIDEDATADAKKTLDAIIGSLKGQKDNKILKMAMGMKKSYEDNKGFSKQQAQWIYNTSKAMFK